MTHLTSQVGFVHRGLLRLGNKNLIGYPICLLMESFIEGGAVKVSALLL
jgi:hypothetical protein